MRTMNQEYFKMIEEYIDEYRENNHTAPTVREIADGVGLPRSTISRYISYMREQNMIDYDGHRNISTKASRMLNDVTVKVPVLGVVSCGIPKFAEENIEEYIRLPVAIFGRGDFYILRANGESMIEAGIDDGDLVLIRKQSYADEGQIVVALMEDEATLKRFYPEPKKHRIRLHPENSRMDDIYVDNCEIQGVAVKVLKDLE